MFKVIQALIDAVDASVYSYIKPGAPHRYSSATDDLHQYVASVTSALNEYVKAVESGLNIAKGRLGLNNSGFGSLINEALKDNRKSMGTAPLPEMHIIMIPTVLAASYAIGIKGRLELSEFGNALRGITMYGSERDSLSLYEALRNAGGDVGRALALTSITPGRIRTEGLTPYDILEEVGSKYPILRYVTRRQGRITELAEKFIKDRLEGVSLNNATVKLYALLLEETCGVKVNPIVKGKEEFMKLLRLDRDLRRRYDLKGLIAVLSAPVFIGLLSLSI